MAVQLGYRNVYRYPQGFPEWQGLGRPTASSKPQASVGAGQPLSPGSFTGLAALWTLLGIFLGGVALNLTPCVYPLIPITAAYFGGRSGTGRGRIVVHGVLYVAGLALTNSALGVTAALTGGLLGALLQNPAVLVTVAVVLLVFASSMFGFWELRLPGFLTQAASKPHAGWFGSLFMGITLGVVAAPCIGPFVLGLLTWVASTGSAWMGFLVFFTLSLGLGLPLFLLALFSGKIERLPRSGEWMVWVRKLMGWILVGMAAYFLQPLLSETTFVFLSAGVALAAGVHLGLLDKTRAAFSAFVWMKRGVLILGVLVSCLLVGEWAVRGPGVSWHAYSDDLLRQAVEADKPVIMDFYADWCSPCRALDEEVFHDPRIVKRGDEEVVMVKIDVTKSGNPLNERLLREYGIKGVPTVVFLDGHGKERRDLRLVDFVPPSRFLELMDAVVSAPEPRAARRAGGTHKPE